MYRSFLFICMYSLPCHDANIKTSAMQALMTPNVLSAEYSRYMTRNPPFSPTNMLDSALYDIPAPYAKLNIYHEDSKLKQKKHHEKYLTIFAIQYYFINFAFG